MPIDKNQKEAYYYSMKNLLEVPIDEMMTYEDYVSGGRAVCAINDLLGFLTPVLEGTRRAGEPEGVRFLSRLMADLGALRESLKVVVSEAETTGFRLD